MRRLMTITLTGEWNDELNDSDDPLDSVQESIEGWIDEGGLPGFTPLGMTSGWDGEEIDET